MKKLLIVLTVIVFMFSGCGDKPVKNPGTADEQDNIVVDNRENILVSQVISEKIAGYTEITSYVGDCDGDGSDETIVLSTAAERDEKGEFLWNDGQNWALYVKDSANEAYVLFDGYVQAGNVHFDVSDYYMKDGTKPVITVTVSTGAGLLIKNYVFSEADKGYAEEEVYNTRNITEGGINRRFTSVPEILK